MARLPTLKSRIATQAARLSTSSGGSWRAGKATSNQRGYNYAWQKARIEHLNGSPLCVYCEREGKVTAANTVDHIIAHRGDMTVFWDRSSWMSLCAPCHSSKKQREEAGSA